jgi:hypothetical protein
VGLHIYWDPQCCPHSIPAQGRVFRPRRNRNRNRPPLAHHVESPRTPMATSGRRGLAGVALCEAWAAQPYHFPPAIADCFHLKSPWQAPCSSLLGVSIQRENRRCASSCTRSFLGINDVTDWIVNHQVRSGGFRGLGRRRGLSRRLFGGVRLPRRGRTR